MNVRDFTICVPLNKRGPRKSQRAQRCEIFGEEEQQVYKGLAASFARRLPSVALLRRGQRGKPLGFPLKTLDFLFHQLETKSENQLIIYIRQIVQKQHGIPFGKLPFQQILRSFDGRHGDELFRLPARGEVAVFHRRNERFAD